MESKLFLQMGKKTSLAWRLSYAFPPVSSLHVSLLLHAPPMLHTEENQPIDGAVKDQQILSPSVHTFEMQEERRNLQLLPHPHFLNIYLLSAAVSSLNTFLNDIFVSNNKLSATILLRTYFGSS